MKSYREYYDLVRTLAKAFIQVSLQFENDASGGETASDVTSVSGRKQTKSIMLPTVKDSLAYEIINR